MYFRVKTTGVDEILFGIKKKPRISAGLSHDFRKTCD